MGVTREAETLSSLGFVLVALLGCGRATSSADELEESGGAGPSVSTTGGSSASGGSSSGGAFVGGTTASGGISAAGGISATGGRTGTGGARAMKPPEICHPNPEVDLGSPPSIPVTPESWRLTHLEYDRTLRDLVGITELTDSGEPPSSLLAEEQRGPLTDEMLAGYASAAAAIAAQVSADPELRARIVPCTAAADDECVHDAIIGFGRRAFRRPLTTSEVDEFEAIAGDRAPGEVAQALLEAFLVSPSFFDHEELSTEKPNLIGGYELSAHELASRLSYMLWGSMPDPELDELADLGELPDRLFDQAERLRDDPKAREHLRGVHRLFLDMESSVSRWNYVDKDPERFPAFTDAVGALAREETERYFETLVFERGAEFPELFTSALGFVNRDTAPLYGLDPAAFGEELEEVELDANRPGFLTRIGFLSTYAGPKYPSPILRGYFVMKNLLDLDPGPPIPGAAERLRERTDSETNREYTTDVTSGPQCMLCHATWINPAGFVLEAYDAVGAYQTEEADTGLPIDTVANIRFNQIDPALTIRDSRELMEELASSASARKKYAEAWVYFAAQRAPNVYDDCVAEDLAEWLLQDGYPLQRLAADLTRTAGFRNRVPEQ